VRVEEEEGEETEDRMKQTNPRPSYRFGPFFPATTGGDDEVWTIPLNRLRQISHARLYRKVMPDWTFTNWEWSEGREGGGEGEEDVPFSPCGPTCAGTSDGERFLSWDLIFLIPDRKKELTS